MSGRLSRAHTLPLRGRAVHVHSRVIRLPILAPIALGSTNVRGWTLRHIGTHCQRAGGQFSGNALDTGLNALVYTLLDLLGHVTAAGLLLLLGSVHLLNFLLTRHNLLAIQADGA